MGGLFVILTSSTANVLASCNEDRPTKQFTFPGLLLRGRSNNFLQMICIIWSGCPIAEGQCNTDTDHPDGPTTFKRGVAVLNLF